MIGPKPLEGTRAARLREESELVAEIDAHIAHRIDDLVATGMDETEAQAQARAEFGDRQRIEAESRAVRERARKQESHSFRLDALRQDLLFAVRQLTRTPGFALASILTLMLGVGGAVLITSIVQTVVFDPLPFSEPDRVVVAEMLTPERARFSVSEASFAEWKETLPVFEEIAAYQTIAATIRSPGQPRSASIGRVDHSLLDVLGVPPQLGRSFSAAEDRPREAAAVALISPAMWRADFAADPGVIGTRLDIDGRLHEVIGVLPDGLEVLLGAAQIFVPMGADPNGDRGDHEVDVVARLAAGTSLDVAAQQLSEAQTRMNEVHGTDLGWTTNLRPAKAVLVGESIERGGLVLLATAGLLLMMACVNVSNLLMVRATVRSTEMAVRTALGASRGRLVRQVGTESLLLASAGGGLGLMLALTLMPAVRAMGSGRIPRLEGSTIDHTSVAVGLVAIALVTLLCSLAPVLQLRQSPGAAMGSARGVGSDAGRKTRSMLVAGQISLTVVLLSGTGLLLRSFLELASVDPGFDAESAMIFSVDMPDASFTFEERGELVPTLLDAVRSAPGVVAAGATAVEPFSGMALANFVAPEDRMPDRAADFIPIQWRVVTPGFFEAMGMALIAGRDFRDEDGWEGGTPVIVGAELARLSWGEADPIGRTLVWGDPEGSRMTVVGVVVDLIDRELGEPAHSIVYRPHRQIPWAAMTMVVRYEGDLASVASAARARVSGVIPSLPVGEARPLEETLDRAVAEPRFNLQILSVFAVVGLIMAVIGVYGVTAFDVRRRMPEIGIRLSLGAAPESIRTLILRQRLSVTLVGVGVGVALSIASANLLRGLLYGVTPADPVTWVGVTLLVFVSALAAAWLPARRATRVDPSAVLHNE